MACLFCKIISNEIPAKRVYEDQYVLGFVDIYPQAKTHLLFIHKEHTANINELSLNETALSQVFKAIATHTRGVGLEKSGFRIVTNCGEEAGQTVFHTHFHVLGGERLGRFGNPIITD